MSWKLQALLWKFFPADRAVSFSVRLFGFLLVVSLLVLILGYLIRRRWMKRLGLILGATVIATWGFLYAVRPPWLRIALRANVPMPTASEYRWETRAPGLETADVQLRVGNVVVDRMVLVRVDPRRYQFSVHWDSTGKRTAEDWQRELGASVVVSGTYFGDKFAPLTPLRVAGRAAGPESYESSHGAFVARGDQVEILDLRGRDVFQAIAEFPEAMVSYPLLIDPAKENRAVDSKGWLAARNFVAMDQDGRVVLGTTETGFFSLRRFGEFLRASPLELGVALNFDGGPLVSQIVRSGDFARNFHGKAEISDGSDVLRVFWHLHFNMPWTLPIVLAVKPVSS